MKINEPIAAFIILSGWPGDIEDEVSNKIHEFSINLGDKNTERTKQVAKVNKMTEEQRSEYLNKCIEWYKETGKLEAQTRVMDFFIEEFVPMTIIAQPNFLLICSTVVFKL